MICFMKFFTQFTKFESCELHEENISQNQVFTLTHAMVKLGCGKLLTALSDQCVYVNRIYFNHVFTPLCTKGST